MGFGMDPVAFIKITRRVSKLSFTIWLVVLPLSHIYSFIRPSLSPESMALIVDYFSMISNSRLELYDVHVSLATNDLLLCQRTNPLSRQARKIFLGCGGRGLQIDLKTTICLSFVFGRGRE